MPLKISKKTFLTLIIIITVLIGISILFIGKKETLTFPNSKSRLEIKEASFFEKKFLKRDESRQGKLIITSEPTGISGIIRPLSSVSPLTFQGDYYIFFTSPHDENLKPGKYWLSASKERFSNFSAVFSVSSSGEAKFKIILTASKEDQLEPALTGDADISKEVEKYYHRYSLASSLPYITNHFKIYTPNTEGIYVIELFPTASLVTEPSLYQEQKEQYKKEALNWILQKGFNPQELKIKFVPK